MAKKLKHGMITSLIRTGHHIRLFIQMTVKYRPFKIIGGALEGQRICSRFSGAVSDWVPRPLGDRPKGLEFYDSIMQNPEPIVDTLVIRDRLHM
jgi:hypothetical protein